ncbi:MULTISPECIES: aminotransferase class I/II-fold pyridoxal phosphate-dependent enzyme [unclassified Inquilinus]|uniref:aminotransferase class I/II-fold pyridoxal phosphate-dependent enzyme n=1 Tax=unclassified Inquilinus TaxID=2645927 RepID=UPI003F8FC032
MTRPQQSGRLSAAALRSLISEVRDKATTAAVPLPAAEPKHYDTDFETLPGFEALRMQRAAADLLGIPSPFFRTHQQRAGALSRIDGREIVNFASYDYLGLNGHPAVAAAAKAAIDDYGTSVSASRLVAGERPFHAALERRLAEFHGVEDAVTFVSGHATNVAAIGQIMGPQDLVLHDALIHSSVITGTQLSGAQRRSFPHNDLDTLEALLAAERDRFKRVLVVVESLYSMDGDTIDLARLVAIKQSFGAWLMVDEAHGLGVLGPTGRGIAEASGIDPRQVDLWMGTLSKTLASCGGYIAGSAPLVEYLKLMASGFVYSVGLPPPMALAALTALELLIADDEGRVARLQANSRHFLDRAKAAGLDTGLAEGHAIISIILGDSVKAVLLSNRLLERGINASPIVHPAVPEKSARLRCFITAEHSRDQIDRAIAILAEERDRLDREPSPLERLGAAAFKPPGRRSRI